MTDYALYVESGPRRRKTMVHVLDLLGCIAQGPTTEEAIEATPDAIRGYLRFLRKHGEASAGPEAAFATAVAQHVMEGPFLGNGDPAPGFPPDFQPLTADEMKVFLPRLSWLHADLLDVTRGLTHAQLVAEPAAGRTISGILDHVAGAEYAYLQTPLSKPEGMSKVLRAVREGPDLLAALTIMWQMVEGRMAGAIAEERTQTVQHGQVAWTARRAMRRLLEHGWEHLLEISRRLEGAARWPDRPESD